jgi:outer membrane murein-binding lipoprotein Lpp
MKTLFVVFALVMLGTAFAGCKASAEVGDTASNVSVPQ